MSNENYTDLLEADYPGYEKFTNGCLNPVFGPIKTARTNINSRFTEDDRKIINDAFVFGHSDNFDFGELFFFDITLNEKGLFRHYSGRIIELDKPKISNMRLLGCFF